MFLGTEPPASTSGAVQQTAARPLRRRGWLCVDTFPALPTGMPTGTTQTTVHPHHALPPTQCALSCALSCADVHPFAPFPQLPTIFPDFSQLNPHFTDARAHRAKAVGDLGWIPGWFCPPVRPGCGWGEPLHPTFTLHHARHGSFARVCVGLAGTWCGIDRATQPKFCCGNGFRCRALRN